MRVGPSTSQNSRSARIRRLDSTNTMLPISSDEGWRSLLWAACGKWSEMIRDGARLDRRVLFLVTSKLTGQAGDECAKIFSAGALSDGALRKRGGGGLRDDER